MMVVPACKRCTLLVLLVSVLLLCGCGISSSYRPAYQETIRDFSDRSDYRKKVGVVALLNTSMFTSNQVPFPFMTAFLDRLESTVSNTLLVVPGKTEVPPFLWNPPRLANGDLDAFTLAGLSRQVGMNAVVSPVLMDLRVRSRDKGFWIFKDVAYSLQIQTAASIHDAITGTRLEIKILTDEVDIDAYDADLIRSGQEIQVDELAEVARKMGDALGKRMGNAIENSKWLASVVTIHDGACVINAGSELGIEAGDRFAVMDGSGILDGLDGQRFIVPGPKIGEISISQVMDRQSFGLPESGGTPPVGSILIPNR